MINKTIKQNQSKVISKLTGENMEANRIIKQQREEIKFHKGKYAESMVKRKKLKCKIEELDGAIASKNLEINQLKHGIDLDEDIKKHQASTFNWCQIAQVVGLAVIIALQLTS